MYIVKYSFMFGGNAYNMGEILYEDPTNGLFIKSLVLLSNTTDEYISQLVDKLTNIKFAFIEDRLSIESIIASNGIFPKSARYYHYDKNLIAESYGCSSSELINIHIPSILQIIDNHINTIERILTNIYYKLG